MPAGSATQPVGDVRTLPSRPHRRPATSRGTVLGWCQQTRKPPTARCAASAAPQIGGRWSPPLPGRCFCIGQGHQNNAVPALFLALWRMVRGLSRAGYRLAYRYAETLADDQNANSFNHPILILPRLLYDVLPGNFCPCSRRRSLSVSPSGFPFVIPSPCGFCRWLVMVLVAAFPHCNTGQTQCCHVPGRTRLVTW
jgi:hypothetical protein